MSEILDRLRGALGAGYVLEREAGAGGMAIVYRAHDVRHNRSVALKVVRPELAGALGTDRFLREIELAARLRHPHILPVFDSGPWTRAAWEAEGQQDSAAYAYGRFVKLWDKADPPLQGRVQDAREALARLTAEPRSP